MAQKGEKLTVLVLLAFHSGALRRLRVDDWVREKATARPESSRQGQDVERCC